MFQQVFVFLIFLSFRNLNGVGINASCIEVIYGTNFFTQFIAKIENPGVSYVTNFIITTSAAATLTPSTYLNSTLTTWTRNMTWLTSGQDIGVYLVTVTVTDNLNQVQQLVFNLSVVNPYPNPITANPVGLLNSTYLLGVGGYLNFQVNFVLNVSRPTIDAYTYIYNVNGTEVAKVNSKNTSEVKFLGQSFLFKFPTYYFQPGTYYLKIDQAVTLESQMVTQRCTAQIVQNIFTFNFTVPPSAL